MGGLACFRDGRYIIVADKKGNFTMIDIFRGPDIEDIRNRTIETPYEGVQSLSLSPAENKVALGLNDKRCIVIDIETQKT